MPAKAPLYLKQRQIKSPLVPHLLSEKQFGEISKGTYENLANDGIPDSGMRTTKSLDSKGFPAGFQGLML